MCDIEKATLDVEGHQRMESSKKSDMLDPLYFHFDNRLQLEPDEKGLTRRGSEKRPRRLKSRRNRKDPRYKTQPITFDEIKEVDESPTAIIKPLILSPGTPIPVEKDSEASKKYAADVKLSSPVGVTVMGPRLDPVWTDMIIPKLPCEKRTDVTLAQNFRTEQTSHLVKKLNDNTASDLLDGNQSCSVQSGSVQSSAMQSSDATPSSLSSDPLASRSIQLQFEGTSRAKEGPTKSGKLSGPRRGSR